MPIVRRPDGLLHLDNPDEIHVLFLAPYAPDAPDYAMKSYTGDGEYPHYHYEVFQRLKRLGFAVESTSKPYAIVHARRTVDYVFSLMNRMPMRNSEVFVSAYCEYLGVPYLGAPPNTRAAAEDKYISKVIARAAGLPVPTGVPYHRGITSLAQAPFPGPYFIKDRFGAASEGISADNLQSDWSCACRIVESLWDAGTDALVEQYKDGFDITVAVVGDDTPRCLGVFEPVSDKPGRILTHDLKLTDHLGYRTLELNDEWIDTDIRCLWQALGAIDYFRIDYRFDPKTGARYFLECNICCFLGASGPFGIAAERSGFGILRLMDHIVAYSLLRQQGRRHDRQGIL